MVATGYLRSPIPRFTSPKLSPFGTFTYLDDRCDTGDGIPYMRPMGPIPETEFALSGNVSIAYQVMGGGPVDLVHTPGFVSHLEFQLTHPDCLGFYQSIASFCRLIRFDKRGTGLSDRDAGIPTLEERMDDVRAVMDAAGSERAYIMGVSEGGPLAALFAATYPDRVLGLILYGASVRSLKSSDYPWGAEPDEVEEIAERIRANWTNEEAARKRLDNWLAPSRAGDEAFFAWHRQHTRNAATPSAAATLFLMNSQIDVRSALPSIQCPTLVLRRRDDTSLDDAEARYMAGLIPNAKFVELPGKDHVEWIAETEPLIEQIELFVTGKRTARIHDRVLATVLFTDIVDSTKLAVLCGDQRWRELREKHDAIALQSIERFRGKPIKSTGDGYLATFDGPARAIECAKNIRDEVRSLNLQIRAGLHTGEIDLLGNDVSGIAVNLASRVMSLAPDGEVAVSRTLKDLVAGSNLTFADLGAHQLKGVPGKWQIFQVV